MVPPEAESLALMMAHSICGEYTDTRYRLVKYENSPFSEHYAVANMVKDEPQEIIVKRFLEYIMTHKKDLLPGMFECAKHVDLTNLALKYGNEIYKDEVANKTTAYMPSSEA